MSEKDPKRDRYKTIDSIIDTLQHIKDENPGKDIRVCFSEDKMNGIYDRRIICDVYYYASDDVIELS